MGNLDLDKITADFIREIYNSESILIETEIDYGSNSIEGYAVPYYSIQDDSFSLSFYIKSKQQVRINNDPDPRYGGIDKFGDVEIEIDDLSILDDHNKEIELNYILGYQLDQAILNNIKIK